MINNRNTSIIYLATIAEVLKYRSINFGYQATAVVGGSEWYEMRGGCRHS
jgi:hypothetical protein